MSPPLKIYTATGCPWAQRATLALKEIGVDAEWVVIDLQNKPPWYTQINPASKVPVLQIGEDSDPDKKLLPESAIITEYILEKYAKFLPSDAYAKAESRYFAERYIQVLFSPFASGLFQKKPELVNSAVLDGAREIQALLQRHKGPYYLEEYAIGDILVAPFVARTFTYVRNLDSFFDKSILDTLNTSEEFKPLRDYHDALLSRPAFPETYFEDAILANARRRIA